MGFIDFIDNLSRGMKDFNSRFKQVAQPIIDLRQMANRVAQPEASTGMFNGGMAIPYGPLADRAMTFRPQYNPGPEQYSLRPNAPSFSKGGVVKGKGKKKAPKKAPKKK